MNIISNSHFEKRDKHLSKIKYKTFLCLTALIFVASLFSLSNYVNSVYKVQTNWTYLNDLFFIRKYRSDPALYFNFRIIEIALLSIPMYYFESRIAKLYGVIIIGLLAGSISFYVEVLYLNSIFSCGLFILGIVLSIIYYWLVLFLEHHEY